MKELKHFFNNKGIEVYPEYIQAVGGLNINRILLECKNNSNYKIFCIVDDHEFEIDSFEGQIILRTSARKSLLRPNEYIYPYFHGCQEELKEPLKKTAKPIVGFCGWDFYYRKEIIQAVKDDKRLDPNLIIRDGFWGNKPHDPQLIQDYEQNIKESHFTICNRGYGNFSMRFYQVLSASRIPILVDTDIAFPLEDQINYKDFCIIGKNEQDVVEQVNQVWQNGDVESMQQKAGEIFHTKLSMHKYHESLYESLITDNQIFISDINHNGTESAMYSYY